MKATVPLMKSVRNALRRTFHLSLFASLLLLAAGCQETPREGSQTNANDGAATPGAPAAPPAATASACDLPYFPVREGLERKYRTEHKGGGFPTTEYAETYVNVSADSFTQRMTFPELTMETGWKCTSEGILSLEFASFNFSQRSAGFKFEVVEREGVTYPSKERWRAGESWSSRYVVRAQPTAGPGGAVLGEGRGTVEVSSRVVGDEKVTVPAGAFDALKVETTISMNLNVQAGGASMPFKTSIKNETWFAEGTGLVKSTASGDMGTATTELLSFKP